MQPRLYQDLEYDKIVHYLAEGCHSLAGRAEAEALHPLQEEGQIRCRQVLISEIQDILRQHVDFDFSNLLPLDEVFEDANQVVYEWEQFRLVYANALLSTEIQARRELVEGYRELYQIWRRIAPLPGIVQQYERIFDVEGEVKETASEELKRIIRRKNLLREQIVRNLNRKFGESSFENAVQERFVTQRDGRYVIPIKESYAPHIKGIVQGQSSSRATVFMEPEDVVGMNNELQMIHQEEKREIFRIFSSFTADIRSLEEQLTGNYRQLALLDMYFSCGRLCVKLDARSPQIISTPGVLLLKARHPLLILKFRDIRKVIPFDLRLGDLGAAQPEEVASTEETHFMILSGPNTGGKTVLLKAVGLLTLMALTGLPIPAEQGTQVGWFDEVMADIGDEQSIEAALSTFSSHVSKIKAMLDVQGKQTLVLLDEIGAATDPQQGSALAQAMLECFVAQGAKGIVTTHYTALKVFAENTPGCSNASMQFDMKSLIPTYQFQIGFPGDSFAIEVAASLGLDTALIDRAKQLTGSQNLEFTELIKKLQEEKKVLAKESWQLQLKNRNLDATIKEYEQRLAKFEAELQVKRKEYLREQQQELISLQKQLMKELDEVKTLDKEDRKRKAEVLLDSVRNKQEQNSKQLRNSGEKRQQLYAPKAGDSVWLADFETNAVIDSIKGDDVFVDMNGIRFKTKLDNIFESKQTQQQSVSLSKVKATPSAQYELKLLGCTFDEAKPRLDDFIDNALLAGLHSLRIVHGKGTGALRTKIRDYLHGKRVVKSITTPPSEAGGSGVTVITL